MKSNYLALIILIFTLAACEFNILRGLEGQHAGDIAEPPVDVIRGLEGQHTGDIAEPPVDVIRWLAVGGSAGNPAITLSSKDGINWIEKTYGTGVSKLFGVYYADGKWIAVGQLGANNNSKVLIITSTDGENWSTNKSPDINGTLYSVLYADGKWTAVGEGIGSGFNTLILSSVDGHRWELANHIGITSAYLSDITYAESKWVAVGAKDSGSSVLILSSEHGINWTDISPTDNGANIEGALNSVYYASGKWIAVGLVAGVNPLLMEYTSGASNTWGTKTPTGVGALLNSIAYAAGKWITVGRGTIRQSINASSWSPIKPSSMTESGVVNSPLVFLDVVYADKWIAVGSGGAMLMSPDGDAWTKLDSKTTKHLYGIAYRE